MNLKEYIQGQRHGKEANKLERRAMDDPFLQDAIDGYDSVKGNHVSAIEKLETHFSPPLKHITRHVWIWTAAAVLVLLIGIPFLLHHPDTIKNRIVASSELEEPSAKTIEPIMEKSLNNELKAATAQDVTDKTVIRKMQKNIQEKEAGRIAAIIVPESQPGNETEIIDATAADTRHYGMVATGRVVDETGEPIIGATISLKDTNLGAVTDIDGNFKLNVPANTDSTLIASFIGMKSQEVPISENLGDITMKSDNIALNEVVVVGFGMQKKSSKVGSVASVPTVPKIKGQPVFGEKEFSKYFEENYDKTICAGKDITFIVDFFIDSEGHPGNINIKEISCPGMETEIKRLLLGSPPWSEVSRKMTLKVEL
ncbi:MAG: carboxypeptidase-like regulatory domain-containing protein [Proteiniphilum sp.]|nr:carboxypeptidase-like regulatory domain-containing protein [Proteiniphilum sp.]MDD3910211.1 carboxypeptidase-like regulatory domain-containing protein [Proteiniphilum sp.]MDD4416642.1 carboxypeptidase-like regulatory domain-containing protein [Proteiniphilum sp.]